MSVIYVELLMKRSPIKRVSKKRSSELAMYKRAKLEYLGDGKNCEVCNHWFATDIHHKKGRVGSLLWDKVYFLAVCAICHTEIHHSPEWARMEGYSLDRLKL